jgi:hypothetical protein
MREGETMSGSVKLRQRYLKAGLVQINSWVPKDKAREILEDCARLRREHLIKNEYWKMLERDEYGRRKDDA